MNSRRVASAVFGALSALAVAAVPPAHAAPKKEKPAANKPARPARTSAAAGAVSPSAVKEAMERGVKYLYSVQKPDGTWEEAADKAAAESKATGGQWGGVTALATYALLAAGESPKEEHLAKAIAFLQKAELRGVYATGLRCQVWNLIPETPETRKAILDDATKLRNAMFTVDGPKLPNKGYFHYLLSYPTTYGGYDRSVSQYGVLGMWALQEAGVEIPDEQWKTMDDVWRRDQLHDGGWDYHSKGHGDASTPTMTAAGVASLFIFKDELPLPSAKCTGASPADDNIDNGLKWMSEHFMESLKKGEPYLMYGIERIGVASGYKYFGGVDWFSTAAREVLRTQDKNGAWHSGWGAEASAVVGTSFNLLFLSRGHAPVVMNKLNYAESEVKQAPGTAWNERPRDCAHLVRWLAKKLEVSGQSLNWQIVSLKNPVDDWHDAPILYLAGNEKMFFDEKDAAKLRQFAQDGGLILCNADCREPAFADSIKKLGTELFGGEFRDLPENHPIYTHQQFRRDKWKTRPKLMGLSNGVRELMILVPDDDPARAWESSSVGLRPDAFSMGADILEYAVDRKNLNAKGETYIVRRDPAVTPKRTIMLARLQLGAVWDPEPAGWRRMDALLHNEHDTDLKVDPVRPGQGKLKDYKIAHLTGTTKFEASAAEREEIKKFVDGGGTLVVDAAGGNLEFAAASFKLLTEIFPDQAGGMKVVPLGDPVYTADGGPAPDITYRDWARNVLRGDMKQPRIKALSVNGRDAVFYSAEDLGAGLVGQDVDGVVGYDPETATALMTKILLYAAGK